MRVLFWTGTFWPRLGGVEVLATKLLSSLRRLGYEFAVVTPLRNLDEHPQTLYEEIPIHRINFFDGHLNIAQLARIRQQVVSLKRNFEPNLVHINTVGVADFFHLITDRIHFVPLLVTLHGEWEPRLDELVGKTLRAANWVVGCSKVILERARRLVPEIEPRSSVIHNCLDLPTVMPEPLPISKPRVVCLARLAPEKGIDLAVTAFASIVKRFPKARLIIAGDGPEKPALERMAAELGLYNLVHFAGWIAPANVPDLLNTATIVLIPSRQESFGLVALEAALMARPVVATNVGGLPEVVAHQQTGLLVEQEDGGALVKAIAFLLDHPNAATEMGIASRSRAQDVFSWKRYVNAYDALYRKLIAVGKYKSPH